MEKFIISSNLGGISNRIKCLVSMLRFSKENGRKVLLYWPLNHTCGAKFSDLFENNVEEIDANFLKKINSKNTKVIEENLIFIKDYPQKYLINRTWRFLLTKEEFGENSFLKNRRESNEKGIDLNFSDVPEEVKRSIVSYLKKIKPHETVREAIDNFQRKQNLGEMVGIHIRRGDFADRKVSPGMVSSDEKFIRRMKELIKEDSKITFFLSTDSEEIERKFENEFGSRIIKYPKTNFIRTNVKATQEGLIDLLLLSKTKHIIGTYRSTFTEMAWWFGDCKAKIEIVKDIKKEQEYFRNVEQDKKRRIPKIKKIILKVLRLKRKNTL